MSIVALITLIAPQTMRLDVKDRTEVSLKLLGVVFDRFSSLVDTMFIEERRGLAVAARRLNSAISEDDIIDKYCDFWECCEFLAPSGKKVNGIKLPKAKDAAITQMLRNYVKPRRRQLLTETVHEIYKIRNDLVHNAIENPDRLDNNIRSLREIAFQLFRCRVGIPFEITPEMVPLL